MNIKNNIKRTSKFLSYVLRHNPDEISLTLDESGWVSIEKLIQHANKAGKKLTREILQEVVNTNDKQRFSISDNGQMIRANQGHSIDVNLGLTPEQPPERLLHGTAEKSLGLIMSSGLNRQRRHHVHLSEDFKTAGAVGIRHGKLVILSIDSSQMATDGFLFYRSDNNVWLVDSVPVKYLSVLPPAENLD